MMRSADAAGAVAELARIGLGVGDELGDGLHRHVVVDQQDERQMRHHRDRLEILHRVVGDLLVERRIDRHRRAGRHQQRVTVGRGFRHRIDADLLAGAGPVLHHERLAEPLLPRQRRHPRQDVGRAGRRERHDDGDVVGRVVLGRRARRAAGEQSHRDA